MEYEEDAVVCQVLIRQSLVEVEDLSTCAEMQKQDRAAGRRPRRMRELLIEIDAVSSMEIDAALAEGRSSDSSRLRRRKTESSTAHRRRPSGRQPVLDRQVIGPFEVIEKLAAGGMGCIYTARDRVSGETVALKVLTAERNQGIDTERFLREARIACSLDHEGLVRGRSFGNDTGQPYFAMEFVKGESLKARLAREGALPWRQALDIALRIARTLEYVHDKGLIHRDIKPDNILLSDDGQVKLCDLGLAREVDLMTTVTQSGQAVGTPRYISPEQARGEKSIDARADIYSLGITVFHMLTGRPPFEDTSGIVVLSRHLYDEVPRITSVDPRLDRRLDRIVARMTRKLPSDRYAGAGPLVKALESLVRQLAAARPRGRRCA